MLTPFIDGITSGSSLPFAYFTSTQDWVIICLIALVLFGGAKIPQLAKGIGEGIREFKKSVSSDESGTPTTTTATKPKSEV